MKHIFIILIFFSTFSFSQTISKQVLGATGQSTTNGNNTLSSTTGELVVGNMTSADGALQLGNGYYPSLDLSTLHIEEVALHLALKIYPNPVVDALFISHPTLQDFNIAIIDLTGKQIFTGNYKVNQPVELSALSIGTYFVNVSSTTANVTNTYKIIKK